MKKPEHGIVGRSTGLCGYVGVVMNPPYMGGGKISGALGNAYLKELKLRYPGPVGDMAAYFLRAVHSYYDVAYMAALATNTISQGTTRMLGMHHLVTVPTMAPHDSPDAVRYPWVIRKAIKNVVWPGRAKVTVNSVAMANDCMPGMCPMPFYGIGGPESLYQHSKPLVFADRLEMALAKEAELNGKTIGVDYTPPLLGLDLVKPVVDLLGHDDYLIDPACGTGALLLYAYELGFQGKVMGFDTSEDAVRVCQGVFDGISDVHINQADFLMDDQLFLTTTPVQAHEPAYAPGQQLGLFG